MKLKLISIILLLLFSLTPYAFGSGISGAGGGAGTDLHYVTTTSEPTLSNESNLGALATGMLKITVGGGVATPSSISVSSFVTYATGTAATITTVTGALDFGTIDPVITITTVGTYLLICGGTTISNGATLAAAEDLYLYVYRTNNTPGEIVNTRVALKIPIMTTLTDNTGFFISQPVVYTTANTDDALTIYGQLSSADPSVGSIRASGAWIMAIGLY